MTITILATADLHIGRCPSKLPEGAEWQRFSCARMWEDVIVPRAIEEGVDLVALAGDVVDARNKEVAAQSALERGLSKLAQHGIATFAVSGNHDHDVLPALADRILGGPLRVIGLKGQWEETFFPSDDDRRLRIGGWSFPAKTVTTSPMFDYPFGATGGIPTLGLLHADLGKNDSPYAPVTLRELQSRDVALWLLGHIHEPQHEQSPGRPDVLYPGSPQAMDAGESGPHGPWLIELGGSGVVSARQLAISQVRYESLNVDLAGVESSDEAHARIDAELRQHLTQLRDAAEAPKFVSLRVRLTGRTALCRRLQELVTGLDEHYDSRVEGIDASIDEVEDATDPAYDLRELAKVSDPTGVLASTIVRLDGYLDGHLDAEPPDEPTAVLVRNSHDKMLATHRAYGDIADDSEPSQSTAARILRRQSLTMLDALLRQKEAS